MTAAHAAHACSVSFRADAGFFCTYSIVTGGYKMKRQTALLFARCEPPLKKAVQAAASATGRDVSKLVRAAVQDWLERYGHWPSPEQEPAKRRAA